MINSKTKLLGLIGNPVEHSLSPIMHNEALKDKNLNYVYLAFDVQPENLKDVVNGAKAIGWKGFNITIPHKIEIMKYLDKIDDDAKLIGAVNTVKIENNKAIGYNTDGIGARLSIEEIMGEVKDYNILVIGAGGSSRAVCCELAKNNNLTIINRTVEKAEIIANELSDKLNNIIDYGGLNSNYNIANFNIVINTTSLGMYPNINNKPPINMQNIKKDTVVMDLIYNPKETLFLKEAKEKGCTTINGLGMLIYQGAKSFEIWTAVKPDINIMKNAIIDKL